MIQFISTLLLFAVILKTFEFKEKCLGIEIISNPASTHEVKLDPTVNVTSPAKTNKDKENGPSASLKTGQDVSLA